MVPRKTASVLRNSGRKLFVCHEGAAVPSGNITQARQKQKSEMSVLRFQGAITDLEEAVMACMMRGDRMVHLVYCDNTGKKGERIIGKILDGSKTMVVRGAAGRKIPHSRVLEGERLYFMEKGTASVTASATVVSVQNYVRLTEDEINAVLAENNEKLRLTEKQLERWHKKCLCLVEFNSAERIEPSLAFEKQPNMDDWLILEKIEDVLVGTSIPYNYEKSKF